jgi:Ca2+-binding RTX toxin-like protein
MATFTTNQALLNTNIASLKSFSTLITDVNKVFLDLQTVVYSNGFDGNPDAQSGTGKEIYTNPRYTGEFGVYTLLGKSTATFNPKTLDISSQTSSFKNASIITAGGATLSVTGSFSYSDSSSGIETTKVSITNIAFEGADKVTKWSAKTSISFSETYNYNTDTVKTTFVQKYSAFSTTDPVGNRLTLTGNIEYDQATSTYKGAITAMSLLSNGVTISSTGLKLSYADVVSMNMNTVSGLLPNLLAGKDKITGGANDDTLNGYLGSDSLTGGAGIDTFVFNTALSKTNVDTITGYTVADDRIQLDHTVFNKLTVGVSIADYFQAGTKADSENDFIIYDSKSGKLFYDADGNGAGAAIQFATIAKPIGTIDAAEFTVV